MKNCCALELGLLVKMKFPLASKAFDSKGVQLLKGIPTLVLAKRK